MKKVLSLLCALMIGAGTLFAEAVRIGYIWYNLDEATQSAAVTFQGITHDEFEEYSGYLTIPEKVTYNDVEYTVTTIGENAFHGCMSLYGIQLPNTITTIKTSAFATCIALQRINITESVKNIEFAAFKNCYSLNVQVPSTIPNIAIDAFYLVFNVEYDGLDTNAPWGARTKNGVINGVLAYEDDSKSTLTACSCMATGTVEIPETVTKIGPHAFRYCIYLDSLNVPETVQTIEPYAFYYCNSLISLRIPNTVNTVGTNACTYVANLIYDGTLSGAPWGAKTHNGYVGHHMVYQDDTQEVLTAVSGRLKGEIIVRNGVKKIGTEAFVTEHASQITSIILGNDVKEIENYAFAYCYKLQSIYLPSSLKTMGRLVFTNCKELTSITCAAATPPTCSYAIFDAGDKNFTIYVPAISLDAYKTANGWKDAADNIQPMTAENSTTPAKDVYYSATDHSVLVLWPAFDEATEYNLQIKDDTEALKFNYIFNKDGQLTSNGLGAPGLGGTRGITGAIKGMEGWKFECEGLDAETGYTLTITVRKDAEELFSKTISFRTLILQSIDQIKKSSNHEVLKFIKNGQLYIKYDGKMYDVRGQEVAE